MIEIRTARHLELRLGPSENGGVRRPLDGLSASWKRTRPDGRVTTLIINRPPAITLAAKRRDTPAEPDAGQLWHAMRELAWASRYTKADAARRAREPQP